MKKLALIVSSVSLLSTGGALADISCTAAPSCESLGYTSNAGSCSNYVACPFDTGKIACLEKDCTDYTLSSCPTGATCSICQNSAATKYKIDSCNAGYKLSGSTCAAKTCADYGYDILLSGLCKNKHSVQLGASSGDCYSGCKTCKEVLPSCLFTADCSISKCFTREKKTVSGYLYGSCYCFEAAACGSSGTIGKTFQCADQDLPAIGLNESCPGGERGSSCYCGGTHSGIGFTSSHYCP